MRMHITPNFEQLRRDFATFHRPNKSRAQASPALMLGDSYQHFRGGPLFRGQLPKPDETVDRDLVTRRGVPLLGVIVSPNLSSGDEVR
jgi:hypothetical protein